MPSAFVVLEKLPLTPSGKVDRKALPAPDFTAAQREYVAPRTATEEKLAEIWREVLPVERIEAALPNAVGSLGADHWPDAARAIMTNIGMLISSERSFASLWRSASSISRREILPVSHIRLPGNRRGERWA